ncbi:uncharacterized protein in vnfD 5'region [Hydra vulgaris]|uniref:uncharacterized protein in vnfD 5'region n=1 Tax=Hydra vulgaris TaxID=6087 RepID=UPI001F5FCE86|nr:uncharacterized protein in vnfD 5'region [Hydra vulgaris]XP_047144986.1 uncharacterized protein in vnfD 5'region [Hydra vulgaris]
MSTASLEQSYEGNFSNLKLTTISKKINYKSAKIGLGVSTFKELLEDSTVFVDKTVFIKNLLESSAKVILITCPRRWGKTLNLSMVKTFLEIQVDKNRNRPSDKTLTSNYRLFQGKVDLLKGKTDYFEKPLNITQYSDIMNDYQGEYPVIFISFKSVKGKNFIEIKNRLKAVISEVFSEHIYLINSLYEFSAESQPNSEIKNMAKINLAKFDRLCGEDATDNDVIDSLFFLSKLLHNYFDSKVFLLLDEYDTPFNDILMTPNFSKDDVDETFKFLGLMLGQAFKGNNYMEKGLVSGIFRIAKSVLFSDINNFKEFNFLNNDFAQYYGFSEEDVEGLMNEFKVSTDLKIKAKNWYNGYKVLNSTLNLYNPWSIANFLSSKQIQNYWEESGSIDFIKKLFKVDLIKTKIEELICNHEDRIHISDQRVSGIEIDLQGLKLGKDDYLTLQSLIEKGDTYEIDFSVVSLFFSFIFAAGYLTICDYQKEGSDKTYVRLPNKEIFFELGKKLKSYYCKVYKIDSKLFDNVSEEILYLFSNEDTFKLKMSLQELINACPEFVNMGVHGNEAFLNSLIFYTVIQMKSIYKYGTEVWYSNQARADIVLISENMDTGMIIEIKFKHSAEEAIIQSAKYCKIFDKYRFKSIISLGINVSNTKEVDVKRVVKKNVIEEVQSKVQRKKKKF